MSELWVLHCISKRSTKINRPLFCGVEMDTLEGRLRILNTIFFLKKVYWVGWLEQCVLVIPATGKVLGRGGGTTCSQEFENNLSNTLRPFLKVNRREQTKQKTHTTKREKPNPYPQAHTAGGKQGFRPGYNPGAGLYHSKSWQATHCTHNWTSPWCSHSDLWTSPLFPLAFRAVSMSLPQSRFPLHTLWKESHFFLSVRMCTCVHRYSAFYVGAGETNSGPHACGASPLSTELSPSLLLLDLTSIMWAPLIQVSVSAQSLDG